MQCRPTTGNNLYSCIFAKSFIAILNRFTKDKTRRMPQCARGNNFYFVQYYVIHTPSTYASHRVTNDVRFQLLRLFVFKTHSYALNVVSAYFFKAYYIVYEYTYLYITKLQ